MPRGTQTCPHFAHTFAKTSPDRRDRGASSMPQDPRNYAVFAALGRSTLTPRFSSTPAVASTFEGPRAPQTLASRFSAFEAMWRLWCARGLDVLSQRTMRFAHVRLTFASAAPFSPARRTCGCRRPRLRAPRGRRSGHPRRSVPSGRCCCCRDRRRRGWSGSRRRTPRHPCGRR